MRALLTALLLTLISATAGAQTMAPKCAATQDAATLFAEAQAYYAAGEFQHAYFCYEKHWDLRPSYDVAANLGALEVTKLSKYADGATHLYYARQHLPGSMSKEQREALAKTLDARLGEAMVHVATYRLSAFPRGATIAVDDVQVGTAPLDAPLFLEPGQHQLSVSLDGHRADNRRLDAAAGTDETLEVVLQPAASLPAPTPGEPKPLPDTPDKTAEPGLPLLFWVGVAVTGAGLLTGAIAGGVTLAQSGDIKDRCTDDGRCDAADAALQDDHDAALITAHVSTVGFAVAGVGVVLGVIGFVTREPAGEGRAAVFVSPRGLGVRF